MVRGRTFLTGRIRAEADGAAGSGSLPVANGVSGMSATGEAESVGATFNAGAGRAASENVEAGEGADAGERAQPASAKASKSPYATTCTCHGRGRGMLMIHRPPRARNTGDGMTAVSSSGLLMPEMTYPVTSRFARCAKFQRMGGYKSGSHPGPATQAPYTAYPCRRSLAAVACSARFAARCEANVPRGASAGRSPIPRRRTWRLPRGPAWWRKRSVTGKWVEPTYTLPRG